VASLRAEVAIEVDWEEQHDRALADAKAALGEEAFTAAWARGGAMTAEEIIAFTMAS
jgi:hypothetical protein